MDAIKKKMQAMKLEKDNAMDRADACEQQAKDANLRAERVSQTKTQYFTLLVQSKIQFLISKIRNESNFCLTREFCLF